MQVQDPTFDSALYIAQRMREWDAKEIYATRWDDNPADLAADVMGCGAFSWVCGLDEPIAVLGAAPMHPGCWSVFMFGTDAFDKIRISMTRFVRQVMIPGLLGANFRRAECRSIEGHVQAQRWLEVCGGKREATLEDYGRGGETFYLYRWKPEDVHVRRSQG